DDGGGQRRRTEGLWGVRGLRCQRGRLLGRGRLLRAALRDGALGIVVPVRRDPLEQRVVRVRVAGDDGGQVDAGGGDLGQTRGTGAGLRELLLGAERGGHA